SVSLVDEIIELDVLRRSTQASLDNLSAEANAAAKQIGDLMRQGKREEAEVIKSKTLANKDSIKEVSEELNAQELKLHNALVQLPNLPHESVPFGTTPEENEIILEYGEDPQLLIEALPHWELASKYDIIDFE